MGPTRVLPFFLRLHPDTDVLENFYRCQECLGPARVAAGFGQGSSAFGCKGKAKGLSKGYMVEEYHGVVQEFMPLLKVCGQVRAGRGKVTVLTGQTFDFDENHCVGNAIPSKGDAVVVKLQHIPEEMPFLMSVSLICSV